MRCKSGFRQIYLEALLSKNWEKPDQRCMVKSSHRLTQMRVDRVTDLLTRRRALRVGGKVGWKISGRGQHLRTQD